MALRAFLALLAVAEVYSARVKPQVKAAGPPSIEDLTPGTAVTDSRGILAGTVKSVDMIPMVTVEGEIKLPLASIRLAAPEKDDKPKLRRPAHRTDRSTPQEDDSTEDEDSAGATDGQPMQMIQRIVCDVCLRELTSCDRYKPTPSMLSPVFGAPESPNKRYHTCPASEREAWSTHYPIKVWDEGFSVGYENRKGYRLESAKNMTAEGDRSLCKSERRASPVDGKLGHAQRFCKRGLQWSSFSNCTELVKEKAGVYGRKPVCTSAAIYIYDKDGLKVKSANDSEKDDEPKLQRPVQEDKMNPHRPARRPDRSPERRPDSSEPQEDDSDEDDSNEDEGCGDPMTMIQKITCDVCLRKLRSCGRYEPTPTMLSPVFGAPESPNKRYYTCPASERAAWSTDLDIKVWDGGFSVGGVQSTKNMTTEGDRSSCGSERRASPVDGKLRHAQRICKRGLRSGYSSRDKRAADRKLSLCTNLVRKKAAVAGKGFKDREPVCTKACIYTHPMH